MNLAVITSRQAPALAAGAGPCPRLGVDVVSLDRIARAGAPDVRQFCCGPAERAELDRRAGRDGDGGLGLTAATWAVKEAAIKAAGGRPAGFDWASIQVRHDGAAGRLHALLGAALRGCTGSLPRGWCSYAWGPARPGGRGAAAWCVADGAVWALAIETSTETHCDRGNW
jgi:phosphopantetheinyl transferase (holo-ACP synthase)